MVFFCDVKFTFRIAFFILAITQLIASDIDSGVRADRIVVHKKARTMELMQAGKVIRTYKIALGGEPVGPKTRQGIIGRQRVFT
jgi:murein L,D-transpeptidase YafK